VGCISLNKKREIKKTIPLKNRIKGQVWWLMPVIPAPREAEIRRIAV
jgi:hypothetical protein